MDPVTGTFAAKSLASAATGASTFVSMRQKAGIADQNAFIGRTRALQTDTTARRNLSDELGDARAAMATGGARPDVGTLAILKGIRKVRDRERDIQYGSAMQQVADFQNQASNARTGAIFGLASGTIGARPSLFDYSEYVGSQ